MKGSSISFSWQNRTGKCGRENGPGCGRRLRAALVLICFFLLSLLLLDRLQREREALAGRVAPSVLRFHILANSDSRRDQQVKLEIRSLILDYAGRLLPPETGKAETQAFFAAQKREIERIAEEYLHRQGLPYRAELRLARDYFPTRVYDRFVFPCGVYDAVQITLGKGKGHNWWCVLYPRFCFLDAACLPPSEESIRLLKKELKQDDYLAVEDDRPVLELRMKLFPAFHVTLPQPAP